MRDTEIYRAARGVRAGHVREFTHTATAERAGTSGGALKERWQEPAELLIDALLDAVGPLPDDPGDAGLRTELLYVAERLAREFGQHGDLLVDIMARLRTQAGAGTGLPRTFPPPPDRLRAKSSGGRCSVASCTPEADPRLVLSLVPALLTYRVLLRDPAPDDRLAERLVDTVLLPRLLRY